MTYIYIIFGIMALVLLVGMVYLGVIIARALFALDEEHWDGRDE